MKKIDKLLLFKPEEGETDEEFAHRAFVAYQHEMRGCTCDYGDHFGAEIRRDPDCPAEHDDGH